jgi:hypothetical protein
VVFRAFFEMQLAFGYFGVELGDLVEDRGKLGRADAAGEARRGLVGDRLLAALLPFGYNLSEPQFFTPYASAGPRARA